MAGLNYAGGGQPIKTLIPGVTVLDGYKALETPLIAQIAQRNVQQYAAGKAEAEAVAVDDSNSKKMQGLLIGAAATFLLFKYVIK